MVPPLKVFKLTDHPRTANLLLSMNSSSYIKMRKQSSLASRQVFNRCTRRTLVLSYKSTAGCRYHWRRLKKQVNSLFLSSLINSLILSTFFVFIFKHRILKLNLSYDLDQGFSPSRTSSPSWIFEALVPVPKVAIQSRNLRTDFLQGIWKLRTVRTARNSILGFETFLKNISLCLSESNMIDKFIGTQ